MAYEFDLIRQLHPYFWNNNIYFGIYIACLVCLFLFRKKEGWTGPYRAVFWYSVVALIGICYNPLFTRLTFTRLFLYDMSVYVRVYLILPIFFTVAYVVTGLVSKLPRLFGDLVIVGIVAVTVVFGQTYADHNLYIAAENPYKVNSQSIQICDMIEQDKEQGERAKIIMPEKLDEIYGTDLVSWGIRQYDSDMLLSTRFPVKVSEEEIESGEFKSFLEEMEDKFDEPIYFLCLHDRSTEDAMESYGYRKLGETVHFSVMHLEG